MRRFFVFGSILMLFFAACSKEEKISFTNTDPIENNCEDCPKIAIDLPIAQPETLPEAQNINEALREFAISILNYTDEDRPDSIADAIADFNLQYKKLKDAYPENIVPWEAKIEGEVSYENQKIVSIIMDSYIFTGGAHGYGSTSFLNFDTRTGKELSVEDIFINPEEFTVFVETIFRKQNDLNPGVNINSTGFMFEDDQFHLPQSIGFDQQGIILIYNPYEIASYADGQTKIHVPIAQAKPYIKPDFLDTVD